MKVTLIPHQSSWQIDFENQCGKIKSSLAFLETSIEHIGSTSLRDIAAKPIIDILVGVKEEKNLDQVIEPLIGCGYAYVEQFNAHMPYRRFFVDLIPIGSKKIPTILDQNHNLAFGKDYYSIANVHVVQHGSYHWTRHIAFREYMRANESARKAYETLKLSISKIEFDDFLEYNSYKEEFILEHQEKAMDWYQKIIRDVSN